MVHIVKFRTFKLLCIINEVVDQLEPVVVCLELRLGLLTIRFFERWYCVQPLLKLQLHTFATTDHLLIFDLLVQSSELLQPVNLQALVLVEPLKLDFLHLDVELVHLFDQLLIFKRHFFAAQLFRRILSA